MRIGIDVQRLFGPLTGVRRYLATLLDELLTVPRSPPITLFAFRFLTRCSIPGGDGWTGYQLRCLRAFPERLYFKLLQLGLSFPINTGCDVNFFPNYVGYPVRGGRSCIVVHDVSFLHFPQFTEPANLRYLRMALPRALRRADAILADSESTRRDLERFYAVGQKVTVVPAPVAPVFRPLPHDATEPVLRRLGLTQPYILCVGTIEPRKNFEAMLRAFAALPAELARDYRLVIVGSRGWLAESFYAELQRSPVRDRIHLLGVVPDSDLAALYNQAFVVVLPSFYEGFGLPVVEAMACGCPAIATDVSSLPEVGGDAALLVPPGSDDALVQAVVRLMTNRSLRDQLVERGFARAALYRPPNVVHQLYAVLAALG